MFEKIQTKNFLLGMLHEELAQNILNASEFVHVDLREAIIEPNKPIENVFFPESGVLSVVTVMDKEKLVEVANVGREGFVGVPVLLGVTSTPEKIFCQVEASGWSLPATTFRNLLSEHRELLATCNLYQSTFLQQVARNSGCNWVHSVEERCARWLLLTHDRVDGDAFFLTQEFLALMLGVTRSGVNLAAGALAKAGLITYIRGKIIILDRAGLERATCECYSVIRSYFNQTFGLD